VPEESRWARVFDDDAEAIRIAAIRKKRRRTPGHPGHASRPPLTGADVNRRRMEAAPPVA
jgi:hypothetical protein